ncbi:MAG: glycogen synthase GlgA [Gammaproteobacteria bacterium]|nr:MAG: glycogen synthase GlgA [Gammaproteobacteria bacterium]
MHSILYAASEAHPFIKTGGLGDVAGNLPLALKSLGQDIRLAIPAYRPVLRQHPDAQTAATLSIPGVDEPVRILETRIPDSEVPCYLVDIPRFFDREGHPYIGPDGHDWPDNAQRFAAFSRALVAMAQGLLGWRPHILHANDWQTGLAPALLSLEETRPALTFTIHNLAYRGIFPAETFAALDLPGRLWSVDGLEFYGQVCFIKGGIVFSDMINTVSPTYAREIQTPAFGHGLDGLLRARAERLVGIVNGIDVKAWDPARDPHIPYPYDIERLERKRLNKPPLKETFALDGEDRPLIGMIGRLAEQKGFDLVLAALPRLMDMGIQMAVLGEGEAHLEAGLKQAASAHPGRFGAKITFDEGLAHLITAGADMFLMPSRFEPCGLNQMYSQRYGTVPIVHRVGGLADTVVDANEDNLIKGIATGIQFVPASPEGVLEGVERGLALFRQPDIWRQLMENGMRQDFSWHKSAWHYLAFYRQALRYAQGSFHGS